MSVLTCASYKSAWRGYDYYRKENVVSVTPDKEVGVYKAKVQGSGTEPYDVSLNIVHPRKTTCNCPFASGTSKICKHSVAAYFTLFPEEAEEYYQNVILPAEEAEKEAEMAEEKFENYVRSLSREELIDTIFYLWNVLPDWAQEEFLYENDIVDDDEEYDEDSDGNSDDCSDFNGDVSFPLAEIVANLYNTSFTYTNYIDKSNGNAVMVLEGEVLGDSDVTNEDIEYDEKRFIPLPTGRDIDSYDIMKQFISTVDDGRIREKLNNAIHQKGAYRKFKDEVRYLSLEKQWYAFSDEKYERAALEWCKEHGIKPIK